MIGILDSNQKIVTDSLVLQLDPAQKRSYSGTGTTYTDISANGRDGTLFNTPTYNTTNGGTFTFDGINEYYDIGAALTKLQFQPTQAYSVFCWVYNIGSAGPIVANMLDNGSTYPGWDLFRNSSTQLAMHLISSWITNAIKIYVTFSPSANTWYNIGYTYDGSCPTTVVNSVTSVDFYSNASSLTTGKASENNDAFDSSSTTITYGSRFFISRRFNSSGYFNQTIGPILIYNKKLTTTEITQNYNALKGRFGL